MDGSKICDCLRWVSVGVLHGPLRLFANGAAQAVIEIATTEFARYCPAVEAEEYSLTDNVDWRSTMGDSSALRSSLAQRLKTSSRSVE